MSASAPAPSPPAGALPPPPAPPSPGPRFYCYMCDAMVAPPAAAPAAQLLHCPLCGSGFLEENPNSSPPAPPPPPPPLLPGSGSSSSSGLSDGPDDDGGGGGDDAEGLGLGLGLDMDPAEARAYLGRLLHRRLYDGPPFDASSAALRHRPGPGAGWGAPPAPAASIAALPTVEVADPAAACAICKDDLPPASQARRLPCAHLYHSPCIVTWLEMHNSCPVCRFRIPASSSPAADEAAAPPPPPTRITIRFTTTARHHRRRGARAGGDAAFLAPPVSASPTQLAQAVTGEGAGGPANSGETVSSEWPPHPEADTVMSEAREGDGFFD